ncbi:YraN family protein [Deltaproteobacteria bacterium Smac51]|nr:YraN family protein [Deltaproteobacteria bacterium Smac51]
MRLRRSKLKVSISMRGDNRELGRKGEDLAASHLEGLGYKIVGRNVVNALGELDLVAVDGRTVVVVEVKTRARAGRRPSDAVDFRKRKKLTMVASLFLQSRKWSDRPARFDVVEVVSPPGGAPMVRHIINAFEAVV